MSVSPQQVSNMQMGSQRTFPARWDVTCQILFPGSEEDRRKQKGWPLAVPAIHRLSTLRRIVRVAHQYRLEVIEVATTCQPRRTVRAQA
jgi:hypothetical protein